MEDIAGYAQAQAERLGRSLGFSMSTNGTVLDERRIRFLRTYAVHLQVSTDGVAAAQNRARPFRDGTGSADAVDRNLRLLVREKLLHRLVAVMTPETLPWLAQSLQCLARIGVPEIYFAPNYLATWDAAACSLFERSVRAMADAYADFFRAGDLRRVDPLYSKMVTHVVRGTQPVPTCGFGREELAVSPAGHLYPCDRTVGEDKDLDLRLGHVTSGIDRERAHALGKRRTKLDPECKACTLGPRCSSWCGCAQLETTGELGKVSPVFCWLERLFIAEADRLAATLFAERNPTFLRDLYPLELVPKASRRLGPLREVR
jgi:uncharacterized protein